MYIKFFGKAPDEFAWNFCRAVRSYSETVTMAQLQGYLMVQTDALGLSKLHTNFLKKSLVAIQQCHLLADKSTLDLHGNPQAQSKPLTMDDLANFIPENH